MASVRAEGRQADGAANMLEQQGDRLSPALSRATNDPQCLV